MKQAIRSRNIVTPAEVRPGLVVVENRNIRSIEPFDRNEHEMNVIDVGERFLLPGLVDVHVHINEPGRTEWEGFETASRAAAAGGCTCLVDMPLNCIPSTSSVTALEQKRSALKGKAHVDLAFWGAVVPGNAGEIKPLAQAGVRGFKCFLTHPGTEEFAMVTEADLRQALPSIAETGLPLLVHAELPAPIEEARTALETEQADWRSYRTYLRSRPENAELQAISLMINLCREYSCPIHIVHLGTASALQQLANARAQGLPLTVETCPHYLFFEAESIRDGATEFKCAPPLRDSANRNGLWQGLADGVIDLIATDHSPCPPEMKCFESGSFRSAWGGISSLSLSFSAIWTEASRRGFTIQDVVRWMAEAPAKLAGLDETKGRIEPGFDADLVVVDLNTPFEVTPERLHFRHHCTPYLGQKLIGDVQMTLLGGRVCFDHGTVNTNREGREVLR